jgi:pyruvate dehydrogenase E2 component (dihydrolipoamide acetyltransferase)
MHADRADPTKGAEVEKPARPAVDYSRFGKIERIQRSRIRQIASDNLARNWATIPHVTNFDHADISALEEFRKQVNAEQRDGSARLTLLPFILKAAALALQRYPAFNSTVEGNESIVRSYRHIGFAVDTPEGLVVPVVRDADKKGLLDIARESDELVRLARAGKLGPDRMQGGLFYRFEPG